MRNYDQTDKGPTDKNQKQPDMEQGEQQDQLTKILDAALKKYAAVEPRVGLEQRILARLQSEREQRPAFASWRWGVTAAVLATIIVTIGLAWRQTKPTQPVARRPSTIQGEANPTTQLASTGNPDNASPIRKGASPKPGRRRVRTAASPPKLDQFPSAQPLSQEELALVRYVQSFPEDATLIAQAQEEFEIETQKEMNDTGSRTRTSVPIHEER